MESHTTNKRGDRSLRFRLWMILVLSKVWKITKVAGAWEWKHLPTQLSVMGRGSVITLKVLGRGFVQLLKTIAEMDRPKRSRSSRSPVRKQSQPRPPEFVIFQQTPATRKRRKKKTSDQDDMDKLLFG